MKLNGGHYWKYQLNTNRIGGMNPPPCVPGPQASARPTSLGPYLHDVSSVMDSKTVYLVDAARK